jgi:hypothetical protein
MPNAGSVHWLVAVLFANLAALACGGDETTLAAPPQPFDPATSPASEELSSAVNPSLPDRCSQGPGWGRDFTTGACAQHASICDVPSTEAPFETEQECLTDCRCADVAQAVQPNGRIAYGPERISLECGCRDDLYCPTSLQQAVRDTCDRAEPSAKLIKGCGRVRLVRTFLVGGESVVFDAASGALIGTSFSSDVPDLRCGTATVIAGRELDCEATTQCNPCPSSSSGLPACE